MKQIIIFTFIASIIAGCSGSGAKKDKEVISVTILPQEYFVEKIAGELFEINVMIPPGASPATYEPTPVQLTSVAGSDLYLKMGFTGFEMAWMEKIASANKSMKIIDLSEGVDLIMERSAHDKEVQEEGHHHGGVDPHIWLSPENGKIIAGNIFRALSDQYPDHSETFRKNLEDFNRELDSLELYIHSKLDSLSSRAFFTYHPSLSYFAREYNLEQYPLELGGKTPSAGHMKYLADIGQAQHVRTIFLQMQFNQQNALYTKN